MFPVSIFQSVPVLFFQSHFQSNVFSLFFSLIIFKKSKRTLLPKSENKGEKIPSKKTKLKRQNTLKKRKQKWPGNNKIKAAKKLLSKKRK